MHQQPTSVSSKGKRLAIGVAIAVAVTAGSGTAMASAHHVANEKHGMKSEIRALDKSGKQIKLGKLTGVDQTKLAAFKKLRADHHAVLKVKQAEIKKLRAEGKDVTTQVAALKKLRKDYLVEEKAKLKELIKAHREAVKAKRAAKAPSTDAKSKAPAATDGKTQGIVAGDQVTEADKEATKEGKVDTEVTKDPGDAPDKGTVVGNEDVGSGDESVVVGQKEQAVGSNPVDEAVQTVDYEDDSTVGGAKK